MENPWAKYNTESLQFVRAIAIAIEQSHLGNPDEWILKSQIEEELMERRVLAKSSVNSVLYGENGINW